MKKTILSIIIIISLLILSGCAPGKFTPQGTPSKAEIENMEVCTTDSDCICGGMDANTERCFLGNKDYYENYVDKSKDCPDFCSGIAGNLVTRCVDKRCMQVFECIADTDCAEGERCVQNNCEAENAECDSDRDCKKGGCSGELCESKSAEPLMTVCVYRPEYDCLDMIDCGCVKGRCAWEKTPEYEVCVEEAKELAPEAPV